MPASVTLIPMDFEFDIHYNAYLLCADNQPFFQPQLVLHKEHCIICYSYIELYSSVPACTSYRS
jgi:hypothetical protein